MKRRQGIEKGIVIFLTIPFCLFLAQVPIVDASVKELLANVDYPHSVSPQIMLGLTRIELYNPCMRRGVACTRLSVKERSHTWIK
jgi:hypothetical protein